MGRGRVPRPTHRSRWLLIGVALVATWVAANDLTGPAGERVYTASGKLLRNVVGAGAADAFWEPDEQRLLLQSPGLKIFDVRMHRLTEFRHGRGAAMVVLDWKWINAEQ